MLFCTEHFYKTLFRLYLTVTFFLYYDRFILIFTIYFIGLARRIFDDKTIQFLKMIALAWVWLRHIVARRQLNHLRSLRSHGYFHHHLLLKLLLQTYTRIQLRQFYNTTIASSTCARTKRKDHLDE